MINYIMFTDTSFHPVNRNYIHIVLCVSMEFDFGKFL